MKFFKCFTFFIFVIFPFRNINLLIDVHCMSNKEITVNIPCIYQQALRDIRTFLYFYNY